MCISYKTYSSKTGLQPIDVERPWGGFRQFTQNVPSTVKILTVKPEEEFSLQSHANRDEFWRVLEGSGVVIIGDREYNTEVDYELRVPRGTKHRIKGGKDGMKILEISVGEFDENDITRYEDKYGRV